MSRMNQRDLARVDDPSSGPGLYKVGHYDEAIAKLETECQKENAKSIHWGYLARTLIAANRIEEALAAFDKADVASTEYAECLIESGRLTEARDAIALERYPNSIYVDQLESLATLCEERLDWVRRVQAFEEFGYYVEVGNSAVGAVPRRLPPLDGS